MYSTKMYELGNKRSVIRDLFEYGKMRAEVVGKENVFDFSLGNPNVPAPDCVKESIIDLLNSMNSCALHGYTSAQGDETVRKAIAKNLNDNYKSLFTADNIYMTVGAAASLTICFKALAEKNDNFIAIAPYFPEYDVFVENAGAKLKVVNADTLNFEINFDELVKTIDKNTKGVIINSPNNPSGKIYSEKTIKKLSEILALKSKEYNHQIYIISDEPYRELVYEQNEVPFISNYYDATFVCYSFSKSMSLPGERIGYIAVNPNMENSEKLYLAICGAGRSLGFVCASSLYQQVVKKCIGNTSDLNIYKTNRNLIYNGLKSLGYKVVNPEGAFYIFVKSLEEDDIAFCENAKKFDLLLVPGSGFGCKGYVRIAYCVSTNQIEKSIPAFKKLAEFYEKN